MNDIKHDFPESRYRHCHNVGLRMAHYAKTKWHKDDEYCENMFVLGCLHDIGYTLNPNTPGHDIVMSDVLNRCGYIYDKEIRYHSRIQKEYITPEMKLLYFGDMTVDGNGNWCTFKQRLEDIANRHGIDSKVYAESKEVADKLIEWGFDDSIV